MTENSMQNNRKNRAPETRSGHGLPFGNPRDVAEVRDFIGPTVLAIAAMDEAYFGEQELRTSEAAEAPRPTDEATGS